MQKLVHDQVADVQSVAIDSTATRVATGTGNNLVQLWDCRAGRVVENFYDMHTDEVSTTHVTLTSAADLLRLRALRIVYPVPSWFVPFCGGPLALGFFRPAMPHAVGPFLGASQRASQCVVFTEHVGVRSSECAAGRCKQVVKVAFRPVRSPLMVPAPL